MRPASSSSLGLAMAIVVVALALAVGVQAIDRRDLLQSDTTPQAVVVAYNSSTCCEAQYDDFECTLCAYCEDNIEAPECKALLDRSVGCCEGNAPECVQCRYCAEDPLRSNCTIGWWSVSAVERPGETDGEGTGEVQVCGDGADADTVACHRSSLLHYCANATREECCSPQNLASSGACPRPDEIKRYERTMRAVAALYAVGWPQEDGPIAAAAKAAQQQQQQEQQQPTPKPVPRPIKINVNPVDAHGCDPTNGYFWCPPKNKCVRSVEDCIAPQPTPPRPPRPIIAGNDADIHGCRASAGETWCHSKRRCIRPWEETCPAHTPHPIGNQKDVHGCLTPAGESWCAAKGKCVRAWEELCVSPSPPPLIPVAPILGPGGTQQPATGFLGTAANALRTAFG